MDEAAAGACDSMHAVEQSFRAGIAYSQQLNSRQLSPT